MCPGLGTIKRQSGMFSFLTQRNATDVANLWVSECIIALTAGMSARAVSNTLNVYLSHTVSKGVSENLATHQQASQPQIICNHTTSGLPHPAGSPSERGVLIRNETRFSLFRDDGRQHVWRHVGKRFVEDSFVDWVAHDRVGLRYGQAWVIDRWFYWWHFKCR